MVFIYIRPGIVTQLSLCTQSFCNRREILIQYQISIKSTLVVLVIGSTLTLSHRVIRSIYRITAPYRFRNLHWESIGWYLVNHTPKISLSSWLRLFCQQAIQVSMQLGLWSQVDVHVRTQGSAGIFILCRITVVLEILDESLVGEQLHVGIITEVIGTTLELDVETIVVRYITESLICPVYIWIIERIGTVSIGIDDI